ncbi:hypothetical protein HYX04_04780 [Candidatus Woesearchaeota archaeon]|nr:hypothetical protein [Candidatus Woesearchaeota archaeon]
MDKNLAERLVSELENHPPLTPNVLPDRAYFIDLLASTDVPPSKQFYEEVKSNQIYIPGHDSDQHHFLSIRRVLRNHLASDYELSKIKEVYEWVVSNLGIHDSDIWTRKLRASEELVKMMTQSAVKHGQPYSLLGKLETFEDVPKTVEVTPLVVILFAQDLQKITEWENSNARPYRDTLFGMIRMSRSRYLRS